jgi:flagellar export protein FliJ
MRKFSFTLEKVLKVRRDAEKRQKQEYFEQKRRWTEECRRLEVLQTEVSSAAQAARTRASATFDVALERAFCDYLQCLNGRMEQCRARIRALDQEVKRRFQALLALRKAVRALERLRDRRLAAFQLVARRREQRGFDELAVMRHADRTAQSAAR